MIYIAFLFFTFFIFAIAFYQWQYFLIFSPLYYRSNIALDDNFEIFSIHTDDGVELEGVIFEPKNPTSTLLFFAGRSQDAVGLIKKLSKTYRYSRIITFNYRSYGKSGGVASEKNLFKDGIHIANIVQKNYGDFYILGFSLGSSVTTYVASKVENLGVFLVGSFDSIALVIREKFVQRGGFAMVDLSNILRYKFDNKLHVQSIDAKTYLYVSVDDKTICLQNSRNLKECVKNLAFYEELEGLSHEELLWDLNVVNSINKVLSVK